MAQKGEIPRSVDDPPHVLLWSAEELAPVAMGLAIGMVIGKAMILTFAGLVVAKIYRRFSDGHPDGYMLHGLYWGGFIPSKARTIPNPFARRFLP
jgi:conjugal transfer pilus assembly protein TraL